MSLQPKRGIAAYENLRNQWRHDNPSASELETLRTCHKFAVATGLILREKLLQIQLEKLEGEHNEH